MSDDLRDKQHNALYATIGKIANEMEVQGFVEELLSAHTRIDGHLQQVRTMYLDLIIGGTSFSSVEPDRNQRETARDHP